MGRPKGGGTRKQIQASDEAGYDEQIERLATSPQNDKPIVHSLSSSFWEQDCPAMTYTDGDFDFLTGFAVSNDGSLGSPELPEFDKDAIETIFRASEQNVEQSSSSGCPDVLNMAINGCQNDHTVPLQLSQLQQKLQRLAVSSISGQDVESQSLYSPGRENHTLSEALTGTETLMLIIEALHGNQGPHETGDSKRGAGDSFPIPEDTVDQSSFSASFLSDTVFTFGQFSLGSHVDLKAHVIIHLVSSMLRRIQKSVDAVMVENLLGSEDEPQSTDRNTLTSKRKKQESPDISVAQSSSPMLAAARAAVRHLYLEEKKVFDKLEEVKSRY